jgi:hypothetical protein
VCLSFTVPGAGTEHGVRTSAFTSAGAPVGDRDVPDPAQGDDVVQVAEPIDVGPVDGDAEGETL